MEIVDDRRYIYGPPTIALTYCNLRFSFITARLVQINVFAMAQRYLCIATNLIRVREV